MPWTQTFDNRQSRCRTDARCERCAVRQTTSLRCRTLSTLHRNVARPIEGLILVAETAGDPMLARIGVMSGLNRPPRARAQAEFAERPRTLHPGQ